jgi:electron transfer flavoprotein alpha subunit/transcriptional regulator with XRE-family HTH domain
LSANNKAREVWVYADLRNESLFKSSLCVLAKARNLARDLGGATAAVLIGSKERADKEHLGDRPGYISLDRAALECSTFGSDLVYLLDSASFFPLRPDVHASALTKAVSKRGPTVVLFALSDLGRELSARCARALDSGSIAKCIGLAAHGDTVVASCPSGEGRFLAEIAFADPARTGFATVQATALEEAPPPKDKCSIIPLDVGEPQIRSDIQLLSCSVQSRQAQSLEEARIVVVGGAGLGNTEGFSLARELAAVLGGELAATRPPVTQHWIMEDRLIGQTGKSVKPELLFSIGTSGATQYTSGIKEAKTVVAINRDPNAPIFQHADIGVVADAKVLLPHLIGKIKQALMREMADAVSGGKETAERTGVGQKIKQLRMTRQWTQEKLAEATGKSPQFINEVENDEITPSVSFLLGLARAFGTEPDTFLHQKEKTQILDQRAQAFLTRTQNYSYKTLTPEAKAGHLRAFIVVIEPKQTHKPVAYKHEGEEFILVEEGELELVLGGKKHVLRPGESIHFNSETPHKLKSTSEVPTRCVVVLYTP